MIHSVRGIEYLLIQIPADAHSFAKLTMPTLAPPHNTELLYIASDGELERKYFDGEWEIVGKASDLTEEQAEEIVGDDDLVYNGEWLYPNFVNPEKSFTYPQGWDASLESLLTSKGLSKNQVLILRKTK